MAQLLSMIELSLREGGLGAATKEILQYSSVAWERGWAGCDDFKADKAEHSGSQITVIDYVVVIGLRFFLPLSMASCVSEILVRQSHGEYEPIF